MNQNSLIYVANVLRLWYEQFEQQKGGLEEALCIPTVTFTHVFKKFSKRNHDA